METGTVNECECCNKSGIMDASGAAILVENEIGDENASGFVQNLNPQQLGAVAITQNRSTAEELEGMGHDIICQPMYDAKVDTWNSSSSA